MPFAPFVNVAQRDALGNPLLGPDGKPITALGVAPVKRLIRPCWVSPAQGVVTLAADESEDLEFQFDIGGLFDWAYIVGVSTAPYTLTFYDFERRGLLQNAPIHSTAVVGSAMRPFRLPEPYFFNTRDGSRNLIVNVRNVLSADSNTIRLDLYGRRFDTSGADPQLISDVVGVMGGKERTNVRFMVPKETHEDGTIDPVAANGDATFTFEVDCYSATSIRKRMAPSTGAFDTTIQERDRAKRAWSSLPVHSSMCWGNAEFPFVESDSVVIERNEALIAKVTDLSGAENAIYPVLSCVELRYDR